MRQRFLTFAVLGLILIGIGEWNLRSSKIAPLNSLNDLWLEFCVGNSGDKIQKPSISVVRINDGYEPLNIGGDKSQGGNPRLSRLDFATILKFVADMNPKAVSFLPTPTRKVSTGRARLEQAGEHQSLHHKAQRSAESEPRPR